MVTHIATGLQTIVAGRQYLCADGTWTDDDSSVAAAAGLRFPANCTINRVPRGKEYRLAFDEIPLILRRPGQAGRPA
jgi:hypothetical protein